MLSCGSATSRADSEARKKGSTIQHYKEALEDVEDVTIDNLQLIDAAMTTSIRCPSMATYELTSPVDTVTVAYLATELSAQAPLPNRKSNTKSQFLAPALERYKYLQLALDLPSSLFFF